MDRRTFLATVTGGLLAAPLAAGAAQQARKPVKDLTDGTWTNWPWGGGSSHRGSSYRATHSAVGKGPVIVADAGVHRGIICAA
jgi:hypothetical protein